MWGRCRTHTVRSSYHILEIYEWEKFISPNICMGLAQLVVIHTWSLIRSARTGYSLLDITLLVAPSHIDTVSLFCIKDVIRSPVFSGETFGCLWSGIELEQLLEYQSVLWMPLDWISKSRSRSHSFLRALNCTGQERSFSILNSGKFIPHYCLIRRG